MERITESIVPTSESVATATVMDGFILSQMEQLGSSSSFTRQYTATGIISIASKPNTALLRKVPPQKSLRGAGPGYFLSRSQSTTMPSA